MRLHGAASGYVLVKWLTYFTYLGLAAAPFFAMVPYLVVRHMRTRRLEKFEEQFPESIELMARALRAGHTFPTGLQMVAEEMADPVGAEFKLVYDSQNFGMPMSDALKAFAGRIPILDARFFVTAVLTQRETGGNLSEVLDNLASVIRDRFKVKRQVRVVTAHGRITGWILAGLPPAFGRDSVHRLARAHGDAGQGSTRHPDDCLRRHAAGHRHPDHSQARERSVLRSLWSMPFDIIVTLTAAFLFVALLSGWATSAALSAVAPERRRLRQFGVSGGYEVAGPVNLIDSVDPRLRRFPGVPKSPKEMNRLRRRLAAAGYRGRRPSLSTRRHSSSRPSSWLRRCCSS